MVQLENWEVSKGIDKIELSLIWELLKYGDEDVNRQYIILFLFLRIFQDFKNYLIYIMGE